MLTSAHPCAKVSTTGGAGKTHRFHDGVSDYNHLRGTMTGLIARHSDCLLHPHHEQSDHFGDGSVVGCRRLLATVTDPGSDRHDSDYRGSDHYAQYRVRPACDHDASAVSSRLPQGDHDLYRSLGDDDQAEPESNEP